jgi:hypothetical protein
LALPKNNFCSEQKRSVSRSRNLKFNFKNFTKHLLMAEKAQKRIKGRDFWGPSFWKTIHCAAAAYKPESAHAFQCFVNSMTELLPCDECRGHLKENLIKYPVDNFLNNNHETFFWSYVLHDAVNQQHNHYKPNKPPKISPPFDTVKQYYFEALSEECKACQSI